MQKVTWPKWSWPILSWFLRNFDRAVQFFMTFLSLFVGEPTTASRQMSYEWNCLEDFDRGQNSSKTRENLVMSRSLSSWARWPWGFWDRFPILHTAGDKFSSRIVKFSFFSRKYANIWMRSERLCNSDIVVTHAGFLPRYSCPFDQ